MNDLTDAKMGLCVELVARMAGLVSDLAGLNDEHADAFGSRLLEGRVPTGSNPAEWRRFVRAGLLEMVSVLANGDQST